MTTVTEHRLEASSRNDSAAANASISAFLSYRREDYDFARELARGLEARNVVVRADWQLEPGPDFRQQIHDLILSSDAFVLLITPESVASPEVGSEIVIAESFSKRIQPVLHRDIADANVLSEYVRRPQWTTVRRLPEDGPALDQLVAALRTNFALVQLHTLLLRRAEEWKDSARRAGALLRGDVLKRAEAWLPAAADPSTLPDPTPLQSEYILASRRHRTRVTQLWSGAGVAFALLVFGLLWTWASAREQARQRDAQQLTVRAQIAFDADQNPFLALAYGVSALRRYASLEATDLLARILPYARKPLAGTKVGRYVDRVAFSTSGRYITVRSRAEGQGFIVSLLSAADMGAKFRRESKETAVASLSPDERLLAVADGSDCVALIEIETGRASACLAHAGVTDVQFSRNGRFLSTVGGIRPRSGAYSEHIKIWATDGWRLVAGLELGAVIRGVVFSPDGRQLAISRRVWGTGEPLVCAWEFETSATCRFIAYPPGSSPGFEDLATSADVAFTPDGKLWLATSGGGTDVYNVHAVTHAQRFSDAGRTPSFDSTGTALLTGTSGGIATLWSLEPRGAGMRGQLVHPDRVREARISPDTRTVITSCDDGIVRVWDAGLASGEQNDFISSNRLSGFVTHGSALSTSTRSRAELVSATAFAPDSRSFVTGSHDGWVRVWRVDPAADVDHGRHGQWIGGVTEGAVPNTIVTASDYYGRVWTINPLRELRRLARHENDIAGVTVSRDKRLLATAGSDGAVLIFDAHTYVLLRRILHHPTNESPVRAAFDGGGKTLVTGGSDGLVRLWDVASGKMTGELRDTGYISGLAVNPRRLEVAASVGKVAAIWETGAQPRRRLQLEEDSPIHVLEFDGTGTRLLSGTNDGTATLWDAETGRRLFTLQHAGRVSAAAFSRDDGVVATGGSDRTVRVWDVSRGTEIGRVSREFRVDGVAFVDDGRLIAAAGENFVQLSPWRASDLSRLACDYLGNLDGETWSRLVGNSVPPDICGR